MKGRLNPPRVHEPGRAQVKALFVIMVQKHKTSTKNSGRLPTHSFHDKVVVPVCADLHRLFVRVMIEHVGSGDHVRIAQYRESPGTHLTKGNKVGYSVKRRETWARAPWTGVIFGVQQTAIQNATTIAIGKAPRKGTTRTLYITATAVVPREV